MNSAEKTLEQMTNSPDVMALLVSSALEVLAEKYGVKKETLRTLYFARHAGVIEQVHTLVLAGWLDLHSKETVSPL